MPRKEYMYPTDGPLDIPSYDAKQHLSPELQGRYQAATRGVLHQIHRDKLITAQCPEQKQSLVPGTRTKALAERFTPIALHSQPQRRVGQGGGSPGDTSKTTASPKALADLC